MCVSVYLCVDSPLSGESHRLLALFEGAAEGLQGSGVKAAVLDVSKEKDLAEELNATGLPTIKLYLSGDKYNPDVCPGTCKSHIQFTNISKKGEFLQKKETIKTCCYECRLPKTCKPRDEFNAHCSAGVTCVPTSPPPKRWV